MLQCFEMDRFFIRAASGLCNISMPYRKFPSYRAPITVAPLLLFYQDRISLAGKVHREIMFDHSSVSLLIKASYQITYSFILQNYCNKAAMCLTACLHSSFVPTVILRHPSHPLSVPRNLTTTPLCSAIVL